jgi:SAM-dependent methyltransferase
MSDRQIIDVERLVDELKERVARERAAGAYADDLSGVELEVLPPQAATEAVDADDEPRVRFRPELGFSSKPVIGPVITGLKKVILRLISFVMEDIARQTDAQIRRLETALAAEMAAREAETAAREAETSAREAVQLDVHTLAGRLAALDASLERLHLAPRLARLERTTRARPHAEAASEGSAEARATVSTGAAFDYLAFEGRFRPEEAVREHQHDYVETLRGAKRVVDLGCGRGELVELLGEAGVSAYGVEIEPDFVDLMRDQGLEVVVEDAVEHLRRLDPGAVDGIVASHLVEHLPAAALSELVVLAEEKLAAGGTLIMETPNPESLVAGSVNFHRDLTHVRPIHPDTLAFLCESAGFTEVAIRRLSPVPDDERLPKVGDTGIDGMVEQLNGLLYGYQDYAVVARAALNESDDAPAA